MATTPQPYTCMLGAELTGFVTRKGGVQFMFGGIICYTSEAKSKIVDGQLYIETWAARQDVGRYMGQFSDDWREMRPVDDTVLARMEKAKDLMEQGNADIARGNAKIHRALVLLQGEDVSIDEAATRVMQTINKSKHT